MGQLCPDPLLHCWLLQVPWHMVYLLFSWEVSCDTSRPIARPESCVCSSLPSPFTTDLVVGWHYTFLGSLNNPQCLKPESVGTVNLSSPQSHIDILPVKRQEHWACTHCIIYTQHTLQRVQSDSFHSGSCQSISLQNNHTVVSELHLWL